MSRVTVPVAQGFVRPRLYATLDTVHRSRLAIVSAPAGSGKTTLLAGWARGFNGVVAWYRADPADIVRHGLPACLHASLERAVPALPPTTGTLTMDDLARAVDGIAEPLLLVVDDAHVLTHTTAAADLQRLVLAAPVHLHLLIGSRVVPALNLARTELGGLPAMVTGEDLRFRSWEVEQLFRDHYGEPLRPDDAAALARRTDGWAAALALFHLSTAGRPPEARRVAVRSLTDRPRYAHDYLSGEVLAGLPDALQTFMRRTCVFDVLTAGRCDALLAGSTAQQSLLDLERRQALTTSDDGGLTFRYHEVLRRHLETSLLDELGEDGTKAWYASAAEILETEGALVEALRARSRSGDWPGVQRLLRTDGDRLADTRTTEWAELLPPWLSQDDPWVALAEARWLLDDGQLAAAEQSATRALGLFDVPHGIELCRDVVRTARAWRTADDRGRRGTASWVDVLRAATVRAPADQVAVAEQLDDPHAGLVLGLVHLIAGNGRAAGTVLERVVSTGQPAPAVAARLVLTGLGALTGTHQAGQARALEEACADAEHLGFTWLTRVGRGVALAAEGTAEGTAQAHELAHDCADRGDPWAAAFIRSAFAMRGLRDGVPDLTVLDVLINDFRQLHAGALETWVRVTRALALAAGDEPDAEQEAQAAESFARSAGVPGALAVSYAALALSSADSRREFAELARVTALSAGLAVRPWEWLPVHEEPESGLRIDCFRSFRITIGGDEVGIEGVRPRARSLLRLLAIQTGASVHRQRIVEALWPEMTDDAAMHSLQVGVSSLRKMLHDAGAPVRIGRDGDAYRLLTDYPAVYDVAEFSTALADASRARARSDWDAAATALTRALGCYTGDLLAEEGAAEWVAEERAQLRTQAAGAAGVLAELELERGNTEAAAEAARRGVQLDRWDDRCWRALIHAHLARGDRAAARRAELGYHDMLAALDLAD